MYIWAKREMKLHAPSTEDLSYCLQTSITSPSFLIQLMVPWVSLHGLFLLYKWLTAFRSNKQTNLSISISLENTSLFFNSFLGVYITFLPKVSSVKKTFCETQLIGVFKTSHRITVNVAWLYFSKRWFYFFKILHRNNSVILPLPPFASAHYCFYFPSSVLLVSDFTYSSQQLLAISVLTAGLWLWLAFLFLTCLSNWS